MRLPLALPEKPPQCSVEKERLMQDRTSSGMGDGASEHGGSPMTTCNSCKTHRAGWVADSPPFLKYNMSL